MLACHPTPRGARDRASQAADAGHGSCCACGGACCHPGGPHAARAGHCQALHALRGGQQSAPDVGGRPRACQTCIARSPPKCRWVHTRDALGTVPQRARGDCQTCIAWSPSKQNWVPARHLGLVLQSRVRVPARTALHHALPCPLPLSKASGCSGCRSAAVFKAMSLVQDQHASHICCTAQMLSRVTEVCVVPPALPAPAAAPGPRLGTLACLSLHKQQTCV